MHAELDPIDSRRSQWPLIALLVASFVGPVFACCYVSLSLFGIEGLGYRSWMVWGLMLSSVLNAIGLSPLLVKRVRRIAPAYVLCVAISGSLIAYFIFERWMVAMTGI